VNQDPVPDGGAAAPVAGAKRALLIAVDAYEAVNPLHGCVNDILAVRDFLVQQFGLPAANAQTLIAPQPGAPVPPDLRAAPLPSKQNITAAFAALANAAEPDDEIIIYYSGHGVRISNPQHAAQHVSAIVPYDARLNGANFMLDFELNTAIDRIVAAGAQVTVVLDSCHSGGATRDLDPDADGPTVREITLDPAAIDWPAFRAEHNWPPTGAAPLVGDLSGARDIVADGSGWVPTLDQSAQLVVLSGCRDVQVSHEYIPPGTADRHGALTFFLLDALRGAPAAEVPRLQWRDLYARVRAGVQMAFADQVPTLEGRGERPVFGGTWQALAPGFAVGPGPGGTLSVDGGLLHGLGPGAEIAIYPPGTADFAAAERAGVAPVRAVVDSAGAASSQAHTTGGETVAPGSRATLVRPSAAAPRLAVALRDAPPELAAAIAAAPGAGAFLDLSPAGVAPQVEVRPWPAGGANRWALVKYTSNEGALGPNDVIAYATLGPGGAAEMGQAMGGGLVQWARYQAVLTRRNLDPALNGAIRLDAVVGPSGDSVRGAWNGPTPAGRPPDAAGRLVIRQSERLLLRVAVAPTSPTALNVAILLCSDDGNIAVLWPPANADNVLPPGEEQPVGLNGPNPFGLTVRADQTESLYTFKLFASDEAHPFHAESMELTDTVQELIDGGARGLAVTDTPPTLWTTRELPVVVLRDA
jgi:hypothetical protein